MIAVITGGRDRVPTIAELATLRELLVARGCTIVRHGDCRASRDDHGRVVGSTDTWVASWLTARKIAEVEAWSADWEAHGKAAGPLRNRTMVAGQPGLLPRAHATCVISFDGGAGTKDCRVAGYEGGLPVLQIYPVAEPTPWNMHVGVPAGGPLLYLGRSSKHGGPSQLANPWPAEPGETARDNLTRYSRWLRSKLEGGDPAVLDAMRQIGPTHFLGCTCWPRPCHVEVVIKAWRWLGARRE